MNIGFVYILLNPAFSNLIKIGETKRDSVTRAIELSRQTGVPEDYIVLYDELVSDCREVEKILHNKFSSNRSKRNKEFFYIPPKEAIKALQETAKKFQVPSSTPSLTSDLLPHFQRFFSDYLDPEIKSIKLVLLPSSCYLEVGRQRHNELRITYSEEGMPLYEIKEPPKPTIEHLRENEELLKSCSEYDWIMISDLFSEEKALKIASKWEGPDGKLRKQSK